MAIHRTNPKCPNCGGEIKGKYFKPKTPFAGDTFIEWDWEGHKCKAGMKPTPTPKLKARYFAQYYRQSVFRLNKCIDPTFFDGEFLRWVADGDYSSAYAELRHLSSITDEEAKKLAEIKGYFDIVRVEISDTGYVVYESIGHYHEYWADLSINEIDYLRSIGIALPFMGYSVEELVELGWCKLKTT